MDIYIDVIKQVKTIFKLGSIFAFGLAKAIKKTNFSNLYYRARLW